MTFTQALHIYGLKSLQGQTDESLLKKRRLLLKKNHPDSHNIIEFSIDDINKAYDILTDALHGKSSSTSSSFDFSSFSVFKRERSLRTLSFNEFKEAFTVGNRTINKLDDDFILYLLLNVGYILKRDGKEVDRGTESFKLKYDKNNSYYLELNLDFKVGDILELNIENEKNISMNLNSISSLLTLSMNLSLIDVLKLTVSVKKLNNVQA